MNQHRSMIKNELNQAFTQRFKCVEVIMLIKSALAMPIENKIVEKAICNYVLHNVDGILCPKKSVISIMEELFIFSKAFQNKYITNSYFKNKQTIEFADLITNKLKQLIFCPYASQVCITNILQLEVTMYRLRKLLLIYTLNIVMGLFNANEQQLKEFYNNYPDEVLSYGFSVDEYRGYLSRILEIVLQN